MFLMNAPPVLPLQSAWEACGPPGSCRFPGRLSEPEGAAGAAVSARVQMIISSLRGDRAARGRSQERALHRGHRGRHAQPAAAPACGLAAHSDPKRREAASAPGAPGRDSDSDDSVDRGIEEAIQEYLKAKSGAADRDPRCHPEPPPNSAPTTPCPPTRAPGSGGIPGGRVGAGQAPGSASPGSVSSEDSFEQGIRAEIERFLREKRRHEAPQGERPADRKPSPGAHLATPALRPGKELVFQNPPRLATAAAPPRSLRSKVAAEPESVGGPKPAPPRPAAACRTADAPGKGRVRRNLGPGRRGQGVRSTGPDPVRAAADSSSDDGIEEAIQRYQREKRKEASGDLPQKTPPGEPPPVPPAHGASHAPKSALPDTPRRAPGKRKPVASKAADLGPGGLDPDHPSKPPREPKAPAAPGSTAARSRFADGASCRADSAELMCAEAILDISKTILPAPGEAGAGPPPASPLPGPRRGPSRSDGDSSSVDSDDSIEQEIRNFLALKAQSGTLLARADTCPPPTQSPLLPPGPPGQAGDAKAPVPKAPGPPLSCGRKRRAGGGAVRSLTPKKTREAVKEGAPDTGPGQAPGRDGEAPGRDGEARGQCPPCRTAGLGDEHGAADARGGVAPGPGKEAEAPRADGKESSEDKSSSLDSDEDLDTAIKDLLRSKRRLRRRWRDPRAGGRKKVRFGSTEAGALGPQGGPQRGGRDRSPAVLRSCLSKSKRDGWAGPPGRPSRGFRGPTESARPGGVGPADPPQALPSGPSPFPSEAEARHRPGSAAGPGLRSDDSSSVDSDDSIELEIRKFLAEKAKETESGSETPGAAPGSGPRPEPLCRKGAAPAPAPAPQPGMCTRSQRGRGTPQPTAGPRGTPRTEPACLPAAPPRGQPGAPRSSSGTVSARGSPAGKRSLHPHRDQSPRGASSVAEAEARARSPGGALPVASQSRSAPTRSPRADREGGPQAGLTLPWGEFAPQSPLQGTWALSSEGRDVAWKGALGSEREGAPEGQARGAAGLATDPRKGLPFAGFSPLLPTQLFHFRSSATWGAPGPGLFSPGLSLPLQGPAFSAFREAPAGHAGRFGRSRLLGKEARPWPRRRALGSRGGRNSGSDEDVLDLRYRRRADRDEDREAWRSDTSELSDTSVEDGSPVAKGKVLQL
ncbi:protein phosphatase 1 regulatory subunit 26 [Eptesicus fuscus]|uniref:protein phosphatase 1 regulatory subunit 26 n=1 Tax=Eptesicus fuscus TaxID=29078 RepID=UPI0024046AB4|nr:protein phosphatase 1 regulatory subunit 26 [Eptesicus fuscus]